MAFPYLKNAEMSDPEVEYLVRASELWNRDESLEAGRLIFERMPADSRPKCACGILRVAVNMNQIHIAAIDGVLDLCDKSNEWGAAHAAFSAVRKLTLTLERLKKRSRSQDLSLNHLYLAENVAKVLYNCTNPPDQFDEDAGWWVVVCLKEIVDAVDDPDFSRAAWSALSS